MKSKITVKIPSGSPLSGQYICVVWSVSAEAQTSTAAEASAGAGLALIWAVSPALPRIDFESMIEFEFDDSYYFYGNRSPIQFGQVVAPNALTTAPLKMAVRYQFADRIISETTTPNSSGRYAVRNSDAANPNFYFGLALAANVNGAPSSPLPLNQLLVTLGQTGFFLNTGAFAVLATTEGQAGAAIADPQAYPFTIAPGQTINLQYSPSTGGFFVASV